MMTNKITALVTIALLFSEPAFGQDAQNEENVAGQTRAVDERRALAAGTNSQDHLAKNSLDLEIAKLKEQIELLSEALTSFPVRNANSVGILLPSYAPLNPVRRLKRSLDVYLNPSASVDTKTAVFVDASKLLRETELLVSESTTSTEIAERIVEAGATLGIRVGRQQVIGITPEFAERNAIDTQLLIRGLASGNIQIYLMEPGKAAVEFGYLLPDKPALKSAELSAFTNMAERVITWDKKGVEIPIEVQNKLQALRPDDI